MLLVLSSHMKCEELPTPYYYFPPSGQYLGQASHIAQSVKNLPAMQETPVQFLGWEDPLVKG